MTSVDVDDPQVLDINSYGPVQILKFIHYSCDVPNMRPISVNQGCRGNGNSNGNGNGMGMGIMWEILWESNGNPVGNPMGILWEIPQKSYENGMGMGNKISFSRQPCIPRYFRAGPPTMDLVLSCGRS